ncbi:radical SAM protein [Paratractidigestivibacter sp.]|uniref:radical SAM protein n=1 Tax=Paratractidigestivibacter sp. TaxID=2847316 RepID=UPI002AC9376F|nr:radical SAM protein [Paratractidigestivibacter sp.]
MCPRRCGTDRTHGKTGVCGMTSAPRAARSALHFWEEPPISGECGSGAVFFSGCTLKCVFCQNHEISTGGFGLTVKPERVAQMMLELEEQGAANINLVTALHFAPTVRNAVLLAREQGLHLPVVCNTGGYETVETVRAMADVVDVWLPDFKYADGALAGELSAAPDYPDIAAAALAQMVDQVRAAGGRLVDERTGLMKRGVIVRHLLLPGHVDDTCEVLSRVWDIAGNDADLSLMNQYTPNARCREAGGDLARAVSEDEYEIALCRADDLGFERIWWQEGGTVSESFVPGFDLTGVR